MEGIRGFFQVSILKKSWKWGFGAQTANFMRNYKSYLLLGTSNNGRRRKKN